MDLFMGTDILTTRKNIWKTYQRRQRWVRERDTLFVSLRWLVPVMALAVTNNRDSAVPGAYNKNSWRDPYH
jgi:hypothetical protein